MQVFLQKKGFSTLSILLILSVFLFLVGCAGHTVVETDVRAVGLEDETVEEVDPFEGFNRKIFVFNKVVDDYVAQPISDAYKWITPQFVQIGVDNFFSNLEDINVFLNDVMQGKMAQSAADGGRFLANSAFGLAGLIDVATSLGLEKHEEDFAQTLAVWGVPSGPYLVIPVLGPMTTRGVPGGIFDTAANPASYVGLLSVQLMQMLNARASADSSLNFIDEASLDPYVFTRESFLQYRKHLISDGESEIKDDFLDLEDDFYLEEDEMSDELDNSHPKADKVLTSETPTLVETKKKPQNDVVDAILKPRVEAGSFEQASASFDHVIDLFNAASHSFKEAGIKLDRLERN